MYTATPAQAWVDFGKNRHHAWSPGARWQSGYAAACKAVYAGSIPTLASTYFLRRARVAELVDAADLKSAVRKDVPVRVRRWAPRLRPKAAVLPQADSPLWHTDRPRSFPEASPILIASWLSHKCSSLLQSGRRIVGQRVRIYAYTERNCEVSLGTNMNHSSKSSHEKCYRGAQSEIVPPQRPRCG